MTLLTLVGLALLILIVLYNISTICHYYIRISFFYICILLHGIECNLLLIPGYLQGAGADIIFHLFRYWCLWTGVNVEVRGYNENLKNLNEPAVVVVNHQSTVDVVAMTYVWPPRGVVMMKKSLMYIPFFNSASILANCIFVDRSNKNDANATVDKCSKQLVEKNHKLWVFPEGTRTQNGSMLPFKKGAFNIAVKAQIKIVPIVLSDYRPFYDGDKKYFMNDGEVIAQVLPPVSTEGLNMDDVPELTEKIRAQMLDVFHEISPQAAEKISIKRNQKAA